MSGITGSPGDGLRSSSEGLSEPSSKHLLAFTTSMNKELTREQNETISVSVKKVSCKGRREGEQVI